ncbi:uncharacterized protein LOC126780346 isoform X1 [Nymphalis io]|uniref:uncharacterized protein LOC126780346 isoform X1 n=2 Tax=Inachis io TaxID=171585 RepID=UPI0021670A1F|nr:uncharacterized protein LOC126780346 isoform X1 [Nymphalis io]
MTDEMDKLAKVPLARPGFDAFDMSAPLLVQMNSAGKWENCKPDNMDEEKLKAVIQHLVNSKSISAAQSYCYQCAAENQKVSGKSNFVPVIMMPIYPADECPFDMKCEIEKMKETVKKPTKKAVTKEQEKHVEDNKDKKKIKKRNFVLQRLTDFDLLSQW